MSDIKRTRKRSIPCNRSAITSMENIDPESIQNEIIERIKLKPKRSILKKSESEIEQKLLLKKQENNQSANENNENPKKIKLSTDRKTFRSRRSD